MPYSFLNSPLSFFNLPLSYLNMPFGSSNLPFGHINLPFGFFNLPFFEMIQTFGVPVGPGFKELFPPFPSSDPGQLARCVALFQQRHPRRGSESPGHDGRAAVAGIGRKGFLIPCREVC